jgi:hypothetical protein
MASRCGGAGSGDRIMQIITEGFRGLSLIVVRNADRLLFPAVIFAALSLTGWLVPFLTEG